MNPYRDAFYQRQARWHGYTDPEVARARHEQRVPYYAWYTRDWLPESRSTAILDIGCGSGQFLHFLGRQGYTAASGLDLDRDQTALARALGLDVACTTVDEHFRADMRTYGLIAMLDILEHFTREELFPLLETVVSRLEPGGRLIASVPNAESPEAARSIYADITHEIAFTPTSLEEMLFCHGLKVVEFRDPWPAPVTPLRRAYRTVALVSRRIEAARLRLLGFDPPRYWSSVVWVLAEKPAG